MLHSRAEMIVTFYTGKLVMVRSRSIETHVLISVRSSDHITPLLRELHWLKITERIQFRLCVLAYRCLHGSAPQYLDETLHLTSDPEACRRLRSGSTSTLFVPATRRSSLGNLAFPVPALCSAIMEHPRSPCEQFHLT